MTKVEGWMTELYFPPFPHPLVCRHLKFVASGQEKETAEEERGKVQAASGAEPSAQSGHPHWLPGAFVPSNFTRLPARPSSKESGMKNFTPADN